MVREDGTLRLFPVVAPKENFNSEDDAEIYILDAAKEVIDKLLESKNKL